MLVFSKNDVEHTHLCQQFWLYLDIFIFSLIRSLSCSNILEVCKLCALIGCHCTKSSHTMCKTSWWKNNRQFCCVSVHDFEPNIWSKVYILQIKFKKMFDRKSIFFLWRKIYINIIMNQKKKKDMSPYYFFILYSIWVHVESPKYRTICLKSPTKSSELAICFKNSGQKSLSMYISSCFNITIKLNFKDSEIKKLKSYASSRIRTRNPWCLRLRNTCAIGCAKIIAELSWMSTVIQALGVHIT